MGIRKTFVAMSFLLGCFYTHAQNECELTLTQATEEFNAGHLYGIPGMLSDRLLRMKHQT